jgi:ABC-type Fe3+/spermidine/putrescine transport system ATPase subunit
VLPPAFAERHGGVAKWTSLKPEKIAVHPLDTAVPEKHASSDGEIKMVSYQGAVTRFNVETEKMRINAEMPAGETRFNQGDSVRLIWPKSAMATMEEGA